MRQPLRIPKDNVEIQKIADYVLLNSSAMNSTGLYNGRAGVALCLFEVARYMEDAYLEESALELLREALLTENEDVSFENGLSGIGFSLLYLTENKFVNADFFELFGNNLEKIISTIKKWNEQDAAILFFKNIQIVYFLDSLAKNINKDEYIPYTKSFSNTVNNLLSEQFKKINSYKNAHLTATVMNDFEKCLKLSWKCSLFNQKNSSRLASGSTPKKPEVSKR